MKEHLSIFSAAGVNKEGVLMPVSSLFSAIDQGNEKGGFPSSIGHDIHRVSGWSKPLSVYSDGNNALLTGKIYFTENKDDSETIKEWFEVSEHRRYHDNFRPFEKELKSKLNEHLSPSAKAIYSSCAAYVDTDIVLKVFSFLKIEIENDNLISIAFLKEHFHYLGQGVFQKDDFVIFAHQYFRRSLSRHNSLNEPFLDLLIKQPEEYNGKLALDLDMIGLSKSNMSCVEMEHWWGPSFNDDLSMISYGVTHLEADDSERLFHGINGMQVWWHQQDGIKTLEAEEICDLPSYGISESEYGCRYVHTMLTDEDALPYHYDGAIRLYDEESMVERVGKKITEVGRHAVYTKLWRMDGTIDVPSWKAIINHFYRDNKLIGEYFGGKEEIPTKSPEVKKIPNDTFEVLDYVPSNLTENEGVKISISTISQLATNKKLEIWPLIVQHGESKIIPYIEADFIEILKLFDKVGRKYSFKSEFKYLAFDDMAINMPLMVFSKGTATVEACNKTNDLILKLCKKWLEKGDDRVISFAYGIPYGDEITCFSFIGQVNDLVKWLESSSSKLPISKTAIPVWLEDFIKFGRKEFYQTGVRAFDFIGLDGLLSYQRKFLDKDFYDLKFDDKLKQVVAVLSIHKDEKNALNLMKKMSPFVETEKRGLKFPRLMHSVSTDFDSIPRWVSHSQFLNVISPHYNW